MCVCVCVCHRCGLKYVARALHVFLSSDPTRGPALCARLLEAMPPASAVYLTHDMVDQPQPLLPAEQRRAVLAAVKREVVKQLETVQRELNVLTVSSAML